MLQLHLLAARVHASAALNDNVHHSGRKAIDRSAELLFSKKVSLGHAFVRITSQVCALWSSIGMHMLIKQQSMRALAETSYLQCMHTYMHA